MGNYILHDLYYNHKVTNEAIVPDVELFEWCISIIALHFKAGSSTISSKGGVARYVTTSTSISTLFHSKTAASVGGVLSMKSKRWWHQLGGGAMLHCGLYFSWYVLRRNLMI